jgi:hypothetical protein
MIIITYNISSSKKKPYNISNQCFLFFPKNLKPVFSEISYHILYSNYYLVSLDRHSMEIKYFAMSSYN